MKTSTAGVAAIVAHEGRVVRNGRHVPYNDPVGFATIGYGHLIHKWAVDNCDWCRRTLSEDEARALLAEDLVRYENGVKKWIKVPLNQNQFDALVSFSFNLGADILNPEDCTLARKLNAGDYEGAANEFSRWVKADGKVLDGLVARRAAEKKLFLTPLTATSTEQESPVFHPVLIVNRHSRRVLDVASRADGSHDRGAKVVQNGAHALPNQRFVIEEIDNQEYRIRVAGSGLVLDVVGMSKENGAEVQVWTWHGGANQRWRLVAAEDEHFVIESVGAPGRVLDVANLSPHVAAPIQIWDRIEATGRNQEWSAVWTADTGVADLVNPPEPVITKPVPNQITAYEARAQIDRWGFEDGVAGFQQAYAFADLAVDGDVGPATVAAVLDVVERGGKLSEFFSINELRSKGNGQVRSHRQLLRRLDAVRRAKGSFSPVSGFRDPAHNRRVGGATNSQHVYGTACDIPASLGLTIDEARRLGFSGVGHANGVVIHVDVRAEGPDNTTGGRIGSPTVWAY